MRTCPGRLLVGLLALTTGLLSAPAPASAAPAGDPSPGPSSGASFDLTAPSHGRKAVEQLGADLDRAAEINGMTAPELRRLLVGDHTAWVDTHGRVFFVDPAPADVATRTPQPAYAAASTFALHSAPGSQHVIFLDFDGADVSGTVWNTDHGLAGGFQSGWSIDADPATFSTAEQAVIQRVWQQVAEDYAPFDVDVTTQDPGDAAIDRSGLADPTYGTRALISSSDAAWQAVCERECGGIAYVGVFDMTSEHAGFQPAWVFGQALGDNAKYIAEAVSHEVGHNFGLDHDGNAAEGYDAGHDPWAPIMGVGYEQPVSQWSKGDYLGANNHEDDLAIIAAGGAPLRADEAGGSVLTAATGLPAGPAYITARGDVDVYALGACSGALTVTADSAPTGPNLDIRLSLLALDGGTVATSDPPSARVDNTTATGLGASISATVPAGAYFVSVDGVGNGTPETGYDDYGSVGAYSLTLDGGSCAGIVGAPSAPQGLTGTASRDGLSLTARWSAPASDGGSPVTGYEVAIDSGAWVPLAATTTTHTFTGLSGTSHEVAVRAVNAHGDGPPARVTVAVPKAPSAPRIGTARSGPAGGRATASVSWQAPSSDGGAPVTAYQVFSYRISSSGRVLDTYKTLIPDADVRRMTLAAPGRWRFAVRARNAVGWGHLSAKSNTVTAR